MGQKLRTTHPVQGGAVQSVDQLSTFLQHVLHKKLGVLEEVGSDLYRPLVVVESPHSRFDEKKREVQFLCVSVGLRLKQYLHHLPVARWRI